MNIIKDKKNMKVTVFTPTYNRAYIIRQLYESLKKQTNKDFEWLIVDDGSSDDTEKLIQKFQKEPKEFEVRYVKKENGGKCRAINTGLDLAKGELFFTVDSDDYLIEDAIEKIIMWESSLPKGKKFAGIVANKGFSKTETVNQYFKEEYIDINLLDAPCYEEDGELVLAGERAYIFYTEVHKRYKYPEFDGEKFMTEAVTWNRMAKDGYRVRFYNDIIWIFEYQDDGLTKQGHDIFIQNPRGYGLWLKELVWFKHPNVLAKLKLYYSFYCDLKSFYKVKDIAKFMCGNVVLFYMCSYIHKIKQKVLQLRKNKE